MRGWWVALLASPFAAQADLVMGPGYVGGLEGSGCVEVTGSPQTFTSNINGWTPYDADPEADCPVRWDAAGVIERERTGGACNDSLGLGRWDTSLASINGCVSVQLTGFDHGTAGTDGWKAPGIVFWHQSGPAGDDWLSIYCEDGTACTDLRHGAPDGTSQYFGYSAGAGFGAVDVGDYFAFCFSDDTPEDPFDIGVRFRGWNFGTSAPGHPSTWGTATIEDHSNCHVFGTPDCLTPSGFLVGVSMKADTPGANGFVQYDHFRAWSGCPDVGLPDNCVFPSTLPCTF